MAKIVKNLKFEKYLITALFCLGLIGFYICIALLETQEIYPNKFIEEPIIKYFFFIGILGSCVYSSFLIPNDMSYDLMFGITRKKVYKKYLFNIFLILILLLLFAFFYILIMCIYNKDIVVIELIRSKSILELCSIYIFANAFTIILSNLRKPKIIIIIFLAIVAIINFLFDIKIEFYYSLIILGIGIVLMIINYYIIKKKKIA